MFNWGYANGIAWLKYVKYGLNLLQFRKNVTRFLGSIGSFVMPAIKEDSTTRKVQLEKSDSECQLLYQVPLPGVDMSLSLGEYDAVYWKFRFWFNLASCASVQFVISDSIYSESIAVLVVPTTQCWYYILNPDHAIVRNIHLYLYTWYRCYFGPTRNSDSKLS